MSKKIKAKEEVSYDIYWKDLISLMIEDFIAFFMPDLHPQIDYSVPPVFLEQELDKLLSDLKKKGIRFCDKLVKLRLKNGKDRWIFIHIEIQKKVDSNFPVRMFIYFYRIYDKYGIDGSDIESIAVFLHKIGKNKYNRFTYQSGKTKLVFDYRTHSIFQDTEKSLYENKNPFSLVILASRQAVKKDTEAEQTLSFKQEFTEMAFERGIPKYKIAAILQFIYYAIQLPEDLENDYEQYLNEILKPNDMTTLQAKWNETWSGPKFEEVFGDILNVAWASREKMSALKEKYDEAQKKIDMFRSQSQEAKRIEKEAIRKETEAIRQKEEAKRKEEEALMQKEEAKRKEEEAKHKEEAVIAISVIKFAEKGFLEQEISESLQISVKRVRDILSKNKN